MGGVPKGPFACRAQAVRAAASLAVVWGAAATAAQALAAAQSPGQTPARAEGAGACASRPALPPLKRADQRPTDPDRWVLVWVDLELPALASVPEAQAREREALRQHIDAQQEDVMRRLRALGAVEQARVRLVRNALAVRLPGAQLQAARRIPGVRALQLVRDVERPPLIQGD
jgi:hypothetical protein